jgi:eukaryotic-like serine/threonine-protein kinase
MALTICTRLGSYEIVGTLGAGGMGEVYRAADTRLKRGVAIKVLPAETSSNVERLARLQREAELLAALNHPNIGQIYGIHDLDGTKGTVLSSW